MRRPDVGSGLRSNVRRLASPAIGALSRRGVVHALARHPSCPSQIWKRLPVAAPAVVQLSDRASFQYRGPFERELRWRGLEWIEGATIRPFFALASKSGLVVDVGANTGLYTLVACAASESSAVLAFEPVPENVEGLVENLQDNGWLSRCDVREVAVSNAQRTGSFHVPFDRFPVSASLSETGFRNVAGELITVEVRTLDDELAPCPQVDLVKIDVEGFEHLVLDGMNDTLERHRPAIVLECNPDGPSDAITTILTRHQYDFFHLTNQGPVPIPRIVPDPTETFRNFLCVATDADMEAIRTA